MNQPQAHDRQRKCCVHTSTSNGSQTFPLMSCLDTLNKGSLLESIMMILWETLRLIINLKSWTIDQSSLTSNCDSHCAVFYRCIFLYQDFFNMMSSHSKLHVFALWRHFQLQVWTHVFQPNLSTPNCRLCVITTCDYWQVGKAHETPCIIWKGAKGVLNYVAGRSHECEATAVLTQPGA